MILMKPPVRKMKMRDLSLLLLLLLLFFLCLLERGAAAKRVSSLRLARIRRHLDRINKPAVRSIQSPDGDIIDCVHSHKQLALDHPLLKNHIIQRLPSQRPAYSGGRPMSNSTITKQAWQNWHHVGHCPKGTIPIRRSSVDDVLRAKSLYHYGKKRHHRWPLNPDARSAYAPDVVSGNGHEV